MKINWLKETWYGHKYNQFNSEKTYYTHIVSDQEILRLYDDEEYAVSLKIGIVEDEIADDDPAYWGWIDTGDKNEDVCMIYLSKDIFSVCFPYGFEIEVERKKGKVVRIMIEEI